MNFSTKGIKQATYIAPSKRLEECVLASIKIEKDKNQKDYLVFGFEHVPTKATFNHSEFDPSVRRDNQTDAQYDDQQSASMQRFQHIMGAFMTEEEAGIEATSWEDFIRKVGGKLKGKYSGVLCALKLVARGKYASFPRYPEFISTEKFPSIFKWNPAYDKLEADGESSTSSTVPSAATDDPFGDDPFTEGTETSPTDDPFGDSSETTSSEVSTEEAF